MLLKLSLLFLVAGYLSAGECTMALVEWNQVSNLAKPNLTNPDSLVTKVQSFGCIFENKETVTLIHSLSSGDATNVLIIPKGSITNITELTEVKGNENKPRALPDATPNSVNGGKRNDRNLI